MSTRDRDSRNSPGPAHSTQSAGPTGIDMAGHEGADQLVFTLCAATGDIIKAEKVSAGGTHSELSMDDAYELAGKDTWEDIEAALDDTFENGLIEMLDSKKDSEALKQSTEDQPLRDVLLSLVIGSAVRRQLQRRLAGRLLLFGKVESRKSR